MSVTVRWNGPTVVEEATEQPGDGMTIGEFCTAFADAHGIDSERNPRFTIDGEPLDTATDVSALDDVAVFVTVDSPAVAGDGVSAASEEGIVRSVGTSRKLGKHPKREDERTLKLADYLSTPQLPKIPKTFKQSTKVKQYPTYLNDRIGDCTCAAVGHAEQLFSAYDGHEIDVTDTNVLKLYELVSGYDPQTGANDNGAVILDVMNRWRKTGCGGHKIGAFADVDITNDDLLRASIRLFAGVSVGLQLPQFLEQQLQSGSTKTWDAPADLSGDNAPGSWGGHCVWLVDYTSKDITFVSWGGLFRMTWAFWHAYGDEAWAALSSEWLDDGAKAPNGFDVAALKGDLHLVTA